MKTQRPKPLCYLSVPYAQRLEAKELGAWFDPDKRKWYVPEDLYGLAIDELKERWPDTGTPDEGHRTYLAVRYEEREEAKALGCRYDPTVKHWYTYQPDKLNKRWPIIEKPEPLHDRIYIEVPYEQRQEARNHGAKFDPDLRSWYIPETLPETRSDYDFLLKWQPTYCQ